MWQKLQALSDDSARAYATVGLLKITPLRLCAGKPSHWGLQPTSTFSQQWHLLLWIQGSVDFGWSERCSLSGKLAGSGPWMIHVGLWKTSFYCSYVWQADLIISAVLEPYTISVNINWWCKANGQLAGSQTQRGEKTVYCWGGSPVFYSRAFCSQQLCRTAEFECGLWSVWNNNSFISPDTSTEAVCCHLRTVTLQCKSTNKAGWMQCYYKQCRSKLQEKPIIRW